MGSKPTEYNGIEESLSSYFQRSATVVNHYADQIEQNLAQPFVQYFSLKFKEKPMAVTFLSIFASLSVLPLLSSIALTIFVLSSIVFLAFMSAAVTFVTIEALIVVSLVFVLWSLFIAASIMTAIVMSVYWAMRLGMFVANEGPFGVTDWVQETRQHFFHTKRREATEDSDESAVLVGQDGPSSKKPKIEEEDPAK